MSKKSKSSLRHFYVKSREDFFLKRIDKEKVPQHVAIIMDGNGRWAEKHGLPRISGHRAGVESVRRIVRVSPRVGVKYLTIYAFSVENWQRPQEEIEGLMELFNEMLRKEIDELVQNGVRLNVIGKIKDLPQSVQESAEWAAELTKDNKTLTLNIALNYSGRTELIEAMKKISQKAKDGELDPEAINNEVVADSLYTAGIPDPELLIRTSGELRVSNFLLWQIAYTELWVTPTLWPDFNSVDFLKAIRDFQRRKRRFGRLGDYSR